MLKTILKFSVVLLLSVAVVYLVSNLITSEPADKLLMRSMYKHWKDNHADVLREHGAPTEMKFVNIWFQNFSTGYIAYNVTDREAILFFGSTRRFRKLPTPGTHLTPGPIQNVNEGLLNRLLAEIDPQQRERYRALVFERAHHGGIGIIGGIGTLYIQEKLLDDFGLPQANEVQITNLLYARGQEYDLLVGLPIGSEGPFTPGDKNPPRRVAVLYRDNSFYDHREFPANYEEPNRIWEAAQTFYEENHQKTWFWPLSILSSFLTAYAIGMVALLLLWWRRGSTVFSRTWLIKIATKPLLVVPGLGRWALFLGYERRLARRKEINQVSKNYFGLPAQDPSGSIISPDLTGELIHKRIAQFLDSQKPILIIGKGGAGKSTVVNRLTHLAVKRRLPSVLNGFIPILIPAGFYSGALTKAIADTLRQRDGVAVDEEIIKGQLQSGKFLILFDGLSEVITDKQESLEEILRTARNADYHTCRFVITSRPLDVDEDTNSFQLHPLSLDVIPDLLKNYSLSDPHRAHVMKQVEYFRGRPIEPLLFSMIIEASGDKTVSSTQSQIYERYLRKLLKVEKNKHDSVWLAWRSALETLARHFLIDTGKRGVGLPHERLMDRIGEKKANGQTSESLSNRLYRLYHLSVKDDLSLLTQLEAAGLLRRERRWRFAHDTFEEYFAASYVVSYLNENDKWPALDKWKETRELEQEFSQLLGFVREMMDESFDESWRDRLIEIELPQSWRTRLAEPKNGLKAS